MKFLSQEIGADRKVNVLCIDAPNIQLFRMDDKDLLQIANDRMNSFTQDPIEMAALKHNCARVLIATYQKRGAFSLLASELDSCINEILTLEYLVQIRALSAGLNAVPVTHHASPLSQAPQGKIVKEEDPTLHP